jgi:DNA-binding transcriptional LysR family regulator
MEMHQVRYFLAVAQALNFTRAAEECNVTQPSLTRAIKQLEGELGGDLFRRERPHAQMTDLAQKMYPLLKQCYESALGARSLASSIKTGEISSLRLALSRTIDLSLIIAHLIELRRVFNGLELKLRRGNGAEIAELLKSGQAELAIASTIDDDWERLDRWPLFDESYLLGVSTTHRLANRTAIDIEDLRQEPFLLRNYCENAEKVVAILRSHDIDVDHSHEISSERDLITLVEANIGVAIVPRSASGPETLMLVPVDGLEFRRTVYLYGVAGRERTAMASATMKMLRGANWSRYVS